VTQLEKDIEQKLTTMVNKHGGLCLKWVCPSWAGVPDRIILLPGARVIFVETKRPKGGKTAKLQTWWLERLRGLGFYAFKVHNEAEVQGLDLLIRTWGS
jgi:hypothetical protein